MSAAMKAHEVIPDAKRLMRSLRDMGYDFVSAVADLVDNSIEAKATRVDIDVEFDGDDSWVRISDNGRGMSEAELREALRYGSQREYEKEDLGKFGLGLKTSSLSQCQRLSVGSRKKSQKPDIFAYCWDMKHIERVNRWEILPMVRNKLMPSIRNPLKEHTGTVVLWERLDRVLGFKHPYGESARKRLAGMTRELEQHLGMVFHRFLKGESRCRKIKIYLNENEVHPWDPFARSEPKTKPLSPIQVRLDHEGTEGNILLEPFILPAQNEFSTKDAFQDASGPANWNQQQGFYIYRADRMIQSGGWCRLRTSDEHTKLARVALSFSPKFDDAFKINVAKMKVQLPSQIREDIDKVIQPVIKLARQVYDGKFPDSSAQRLSSKQRNVEGEGIQTDNDSSSTSSAAYCAQEPMSQENLSNKRMYTLDEIIKLLEAIADKEEKPIIENVLKRLRDSLGEKA